MRPRRPRTSPPRVRLQAEYTITKNDIPTQAIDQQVYGYGELSHTLSLFATVRLP